ncbi:serine/threonine-protein kinase Nek11 [Dryobates pubescens]|uniref:serine/threonine-protein kinase Nek11 n=1 Tax=Dryobates pubescens TaxID=118200 RepID=UPI0023B9A49C|nr:serine/threonine-protein kinase Nek11 [Dryobates pubescens]
MLKFQETAKHVAAARLHPACSGAVVARRYSFVRKLGSGSFGNVYLVSDRRAKQGEELKVLKEISVGGLKPDETVEANLEAELLSRLEHPAILKFHTSFLEQDSFCIVTEYCEGGDLDSKIQEYKESGKIFPQRQILDWFIQLLLGVSYMHERRILHRDLKAKNIFMKNNLLKIGDFGVSCLLLGSCDLATTFTGTPYYMSPEALKHQGYNTKSDICMLNKNPALRPAAADILQMPYIEEQLKCKFPDLAVQDKALGWQKGAAPISVQRKVHLQTLQELSEVQKMTPRERMRLRKVNAADEKAKKLKQLTEEKYQEKIKRRQELRTQSCQQLSPGALQGSEEQSSAALPDAPPAPACGSVSRGCGEAGGEEPAQLCMADPTHHEIPEDPETAEEYYKAEFDSCSEGSEEEEEDVEASQSLSKAEQQDSDIEEVVRCLESVLDSSLPGSGTGSRVAPGAPPGLGAFNSTMAEAKLKHMRDRAVGKLGAEAFEAVYSCLKQARQQGASEEQLRGRLEKLAARTSDCFEVDQLLYLEEQLHAAGGCLQL